MFRNSGLPVLSGMSIFQKIDFLGIFRPLCPYLGVLILCGPSWRPLLGDICSMWHQLVTISVYWACIKHITDPQ